MAPFKRNGLAGHRDGAAGRATRCGVQPSGDFDVAAVAAADHDRAGAAADGARLHQAGHVDRVARRFARGGGADDDAAAVGGDGAAIADQRAAAAGRRRQGDLQEAVAGEIQRRAFAGTEADLAERHKNAAAVRHRAADQRGIAAAADGDDAGIADCRPTRRCR